MKNWIIYLLLLALYLPALSCSFHVEHFCGTVAKFSDRPVILGKLTAELDHGVQVQVLEVYRGTVEERCIIIWDAETFDCNGPFPRKAIQLFGEQKDEAILMLSSIETPVSSWEQVGEYGNQDLPFITPSLVKDGQMLRGSFFYDHSAGSYVDAIPFDEFEDRIKACATGNWEITYPDIKTPSCEEKGEGDRRAFIASVYPNPVTHTLIVDAGEEVEADLVLYDIRGKSVFSTRSTSWPAEIPVSHLSVGIYILLIKFDNDLIIKEKILKQH